MIDKQIYITCPVDNVAVETGFPRAARHRPKRLEAGHDASLPRLP